jgi:hypothetical protein
MSEKSYLHRIRKEIIHSMKTQQHAIELFPTREFDLMLDVIRPTSREVGRMQVCIVVQIDKIVSFCPDERAFTEMLPNLTVD